MHGSLLFPTVLQYMEGLLCSVVSWAHGNLPPPLLLTVGGLLEDEVESTGVDFLRLMLYSILTEQDDTLVMALEAAAIIHNSLWEE